MPTLFRPAAPPATRRLLLSGFALLCGTLAVSRSAPPPVPVYLPTAATGTPGTLLSRHPNQGRVVVVAYHNGDIFTAVITGTDARRWRFADLNDPRSLTQMPVAGDPRITDNGSHGYQKSGDYLFGYFGSAIRRMDLGINLTENQRLPDSYEPNETDLTPGNSATRNYHPWLVPFNWIQYGASAGEGFLYKGPNNLLAHWPALARDGVTGNSILLGNLMFIVSDESNFGVLCYDMSPVFTGGQPILLDKLEGAFGSYIGAVYQNYIVLGQRNPATMDIIDYSDPTDLRFVTSISLAGAQDGVERNRGNGLGYFQFQDNYAFTMRHKIDMDTFQPVLELDEIGNDRPPSSVAGETDTSQFMLPVGNLLVTAPYSVSGADAIGVWLHSAIPDTRGPYVGYHVPRPGQANFPLGAPISLLIHEELESFTIINGDTISLRPVGGTPVAATVTFAYNDVLTLTPTAPLLPDTTYEVVIPAGGIKDISGNGIEAYSFTFSTGSSVAGGNQAPTLTAFSATPSPAEIGQSVTLMAAANDPDGDPVEYRFTFGNGTTRDWAATPSATIAYTNAGHFGVKVQVRDLRSGTPGTSVARTATLTVLPPAPTGQTAKSSPLALDAANRRLWVVNPDSDSVSVLNPDTAALVTEIPLAALLGLAPGASVDPRSVAVDSAGRAWISCHDADRIAVVSPNGSLVRAIDTGYGSAPIGILIQPDGTAAFVTLEGRAASNPSLGQLVRYRTSDGMETGRLSLGPTPRALALSPDGARLLVTRFISNLIFGEVWDVNPQTMTLTRTIRLLNDRTADGANQGRGIPNYLTSIAVSPDGRWAYYTAVKAAVHRGDFFNLNTGSNEPLDHDNTARSIVGRIDLLANTEPNVDGFGNGPNSRVDIDNSDSPSAVEFSPRGDWFFVTLQGNNILAVFDDLLVRAFPLNPPAKNSKGRFSTGLAPQGALFDPATSRMFISDFLGRTVTVHEFAGFLATGDRDTQRRAIPVTQQDKLCPTVLHGKRVFYQAEDASGLSDLPTISLEGYLSCATCHLDGGHDGRTWDFTQRGEGLRNTTDLRGRAGLAHGNVHWSGNFDEIQDFALDVVGQFGGGAGLLPNGATPHPALGPSNAGRDPDLDALAAYVASLSERSLPRSPHRTAAGDFTESALAGRAVFATESCATCHAAPHFTDSAQGSSVALHNVGTLRTSSGQRLGAILSGIDTPTLAGLWHSAPYFHDGSAATLEDVFRIAGGTIYQAESAQLGAGVSLSNAADVRINHQGRVHGLLISIPAGASATFPAIDGGSGGMGDLELRLVPNTFGNPTGLDIILAINGAERRVPVPPVTSPNDYRTVRVENVALQAGTNNTIVLGTEYLIRVDDLTVTTANERAAAAPHRRVLALNDTDRSNLLAFLTQLDGSDLPVTPLPDDCPDATPTSGGSSGSPGGGASGSSSGGTAGSASGGTASGTTASGATGSIGTCHAHPLLTDWEIVLRKPKAGRAVRLKSGAVRKVTGFLQTRPPHLLPFRSPISDLVQVAAVSSGAAPCDVTWQPILRSSPMGKKGRALFVAKLIGTNLLPGPIEIRLRATTAGLTNFGTNALASSPTNSATLLAR